MPENPALALAEAGQRLYQEAKDHKKTAEHHRRRARQLYTAAEEVAVQCRALGIQVKFSVPITTEERGEHGYHDGE